METKCVIIPQTLQNETLATSRKRGVKAFETVETKKSLLELTIESNSILSDKLMVIGQLTNFKDSRNILLKLGIYNYEEIIEACSKNTAADFAFAAFESKADDILVVTTSLPPAIANDYYYNTIEHAKKMAAGGDLVLIVSVRLSHISGTTSND
jgi:mannose-1-phosphate guanylyltransferase